jgi:murein DD-endopeptidase MepM/ murein hydrolase activator NlpD
MLNASAITSPLRTMEIRFDGLQNVGGLRTVNGARFGMTRNGGSRPHQGADLYAVPGTPIFSIADGIVERVRHADPNYGRDVLIKFRPDAAWLRLLSRAGSGDTDGVLFAEYAHLSGILVRPGMQVRRGQMIGATGTSGNADQRYPHLHFELRKVASPGVGHQGMLNRINPELLFHSIDFSKPVDALDRWKRTA